MWSCTLCLSVSSKHITQTNYIYLFCRLYFKDRHGSHLQFNLRQRTVKLLTRTLACLYSIIHRVRQSIFYNQFMILEGMPGVLYSILCSVLLSIRTKGAIFLSILRFSYDRILTLFMRYRGTLNIANSHTQH